jgi:hypothetical protein
LGQSLSNRYLMVISSPTSFWVQRLLRRHGGPECGHDTQVCPQSGEEKTAT